MNTTVPYSIEDVSIPEYSAKVQLQAAIRNRKRLQKQLQDASRIEVKASDRLYDLTESYKDIDAIYVEAGEGP